ncbi:MULTISPECIES: YbaB/EbfC family nucleoid-associated protein [Chitinophagaceae]
MNHTRQQELQKQWNIEQKSIRETITSTGNEVSMTFNGNIEIIELKIQEDIFIGQLSPILVACINAGIKNTSIRAQQAFDRFKRIHNF